MTVDLDAVDLLDVVGEEFGNILIGRPVHRHAKVVAVFGLELLPDVRTLEPVVAEPVEVRELLVRQLVDLAVRGRRERASDEVGHVERRQGHVLALARHPVVASDGLLVAKMRADEIGIVDPAVVDIAAGLHLGLDLLDHVAFLDEVVGELDAGDLAETPSRASWLHIRAS